MTDTPAESAQDPRTPEQLAAQAIEKWRQDIGRQNDMLVGYGVLAEGVAGAIRAALAAQAAQWREALLQYEGCAYWIAAEQHSCAKCAPLRALLSEGK